MCSSINKSENYEAALNIIGEYVNTRKKYLKKPAIFICMLIGLPKLIPPCIIPAEETR